MNYLNIHIPRKVADEVGKAAIRSGVCRSQAIAAALWVFARLTVAERAAVIREYLYEHLEEQTGPRSGGGAAGQPVSPSKSVSGS